MHSLPTVIAATYEFLHDSFLSITFRDFTTAYAVSVGKAGEKPTVSSQLTYRTENGETINTEKRTIRTFTRPYSHIRYVL